MTESSGSEGQSSDDAGLFERIGRRDLLAGATVGALGLGAAGTASAAGPGNSGRGGRGNGTDGNDRGGDGNAGGEGGPPFAPRDHSHDGDHLGIEEPVASIVAKEINDVRYVDVAEGAPAVQEAIDEAGKGGTVVVYGNEGEWNETVYLPSDFTLEIEDEVTITSTMSLDDAETFAGSHAALITNDDHADGNHDVTVRGGHIDFADVEAPVEGPVRWGPVFLRNCAHSVLESITVENVGWRYGVVLHDCERSRMIDCLGRNIGYDGIRVNGHAEHIDVVRCENYDNTHGPGIQAAGSGHNVHFRECRMDEHLAIHGVGGGYSDMSVEGCSVRRVGIIQEVDGFRISDCDVDTIAFSAFTGEIRNGRVDSCTMAPRYADHDAQIPAAVVLWTWDDDLIENVTFSDCTARDLGTFVECRILSESSTVRYIDFTDCAFDVGEADGPRTFIEHTPEGDQASIGDLSKVRIHGGKIWNAKTVVEGEIDGLRIRDTELHDVGDLHDGGVTDLETRDIDEW